MAGRHVRRVTGFVSKGIRLMGSAKAYFADGWAGSGM
jgi:hypothetical protein